MTDRLRCCVPFCRRTTKPGGEWICGVHWPMVSKRTKRRKVVHARFVRREVRRNPKVREYWKLPPGSKARIKAVVMWRLSDAIWARCKREAIERAMGL
jgi:hypothetical protein